MAQIECGRGHLYDPEKYPTCPYCKNNQQITVAEFCVLFCVSALLNRIVF